MKNKDYLILSILTFLTVVIWIIADAWHAYVNSTISTALQQTIKPLNPTLDTSVIDMLKNKQSLR